MSISRKVLRKYGRTLYRQGRDRIAALHDAVIAFLLRWTRKEKPVFNGVQAFSYLIEQCALGPRNPGSEGHERCLVYLTETLKQYVPKVKHQPFTYTDRKDGTRTHHGTNIIASFNPCFLRKRIMLCAHWDTRPHADKDPDPACRTLPVPGANDGASGVAVLIEMARSMSLHPPAIGVDLVLFDLEDMGDYDYGNSSEPRNPFCIGSSHFAAHLPIRRPRFGILLDMVGKKDLKIGYEGYSFHYAKPVVEHVWKAAHRVQAGAFRNVHVPPIVDDHVPFLERGIEVINVIDLDYPHWHTREDTPDKCCFDSLQQVGNVLMEVVYATNGDKEFF